MALERGYKWKLSSCADVKKSKQNSAKIIHRNTSLKSTFSILLCNNSDRTCFFPCINIRWVPRAMLKTSGCALGFQVLLGTQRMLMHGKTCLIPLIIVTPRYLMLSTFSRTVPSSVYEAWILLCFFVSCIMLHLTG